MGTLGGTAGLGNLITLLLIHPAGAGEEEDVVVAGCREEGIHIVLLPEGLGGNALAAALLAAVGGGGHPLHVTGSGEGEDALLLLDEVLDVDLVLHILDLGLAVVGVLFPDLQQFFLQNTDELGPVK